jgi:FlaA1/EpsC-like NDP-sugar epimerase
VALLQVPPVTDWINGQLSGDQLRDVRIEDLLGRPEIHLEESDLKEKIASGTILVTGAAGSIGQELCRQLAKLKAERLIMIDIAESALYDLEMEFNRSGFNVDCHFQVADVRNVTSMKRLFQEYTPRSVFHAAAYKHVPLMELTPCEAVNTNVHGTMIVAKLASEFGCDRFVLVSTDKAVNPTSVMGASKRTAEIAVKAISQGSSTRFVTTRFGNVLGSNGSVIPLFKKQLEAGGPLTVTHPEVTRYFMTIPEACRLVLEAGSMGKGGEIYLFDMGLSVKIKDLAERMIRLSGKEPEKDIKIKYVGLRPGEKLYEELLADEENSLPTHHPRILVGKVKEQNNEQVGAAIESLLESAEDCNDEKVVQLLTEQNQDGQR